MPRRLQGTNVYEAAIDRMVDVYAEGHRVVHSFSGGKDSLCVLECAIIAATVTDRLPVEVVMRDEELGFPDHYEYCERVANRPEVDFTWIIAGEPHSYAYDRATPFWWAFDNRVDPALWVHQPPAFSERVQEITIEVINNAARFPAPPGKELVTTIGIRAGESRHRMMGVHSMGGWLTGLKHGARKGWPIYDWSERDVWHAIAEFGWDYPKAYDRMRRAGISRGELRMGAFLNRYAAKTMPVAARIWPAWFERLYTRFPGLRYGVEHWQHVTQPTHLPGETWQETFWRTCVQEAPAWIAERSMKVAELVERRHGVHSPSPLPDATTPCFTCGPGKGSWQTLATGMFLGDPFSEMGATGLPYVQPDLFRPELAGTPAGRWGGHPG